MRQKSKPIPEFLLNLAIIMNPIIMPIDMNANGLELDKIEFDLGWIDTIFVIFNQKSTI
jgi:hypothetical protein